MFETTNQIMITNYTCGFEYPVVGRERFGAISIYFPNHMMAIMVNHVFFLGVNHPKKDPSLSPQVMDFPFGKYAKSSANPSSDLFKSH